MPEREALLMTLVLISCVYDKYILKQQSCLWPQHKETLSKPGSQSTLI